MADAVTVGQRDIVTPASPIVFPPDGNVANITGFKTAAEWHAYSDDLNQAGLIARHSGLRFGCHSHLWEWAPLTDHTPLTGYDMMLTETDPRLVHFGLDLYWAWYAHRDPVQIVAAVGDRVRQFHGEGHALRRSCVDVHGSRDRRDRLRADLRRRGRPGRWHEYIVERDDAGAAALTTAAVGYDFLRRVRF